MMPFSVLRMWGLGLFGWLILGAAIYCGWLAVDQYQKDRSPTAEARPHVEARNLENDGAMPTESPNGLRSEAQARVSKPQDSLGELSGRFWALSAATVLLTSWSFGGFLPLRWLLHNPSGARRETPVPCRELSLDRPDGSRLHVQIRGPDDAPTVLLTHGWSLDISAWDYCINRLAATCRVITWDLPGLGLSRGPDNRDWSLEKMAGDLFAVLQATATNRPVILAGHSIGGMITQVFCRLHPEQLGPTVQGIAILHSTYTNPLRTCFAHQLATALEWPCITPLNYLTIALAPFVWLSNLQSYLNGSLHWSVRLSSFSGKQSWQQLDHSALLAVKAWPGVVARGNLAMQRFDEEKSLNEIEIPVLVLSGRYDRMTLPSASARIEQLVADDRPVQLASNHLGMFECPTHFATALTNFAEGFRNDETNRPPRAIQEKHA